METHQQPSLRPTLPTRRPIRANTVDPAMRTSVARPDEYSFVEPPTQKKMATKLLPVRYKTEARAKKVTKSFFAKSLRFIKIGLVVLIMARLFFSQGGVLEYIERTKKVDELTLYQQSLIDDNHALEKEIKKIETDVNLQKQLMREHLGLIGPDEYMILFRSETAVSAK